jgi:RNA polymerase sigma factor (TIGR02999 family)
MGILDCQGALPKENTEQDLFVAVYAELKRIASCHMRSERLGLTIQTTALVHETYLKLAHNIRIATKGYDRQRFLRIASQAMRRILVDRARARCAKKRECPPFPGFAGAARYTDLHDALERLAAAEPRSAQIVEMRFFLGLTEEEIADTLGICSRTVKRDWQFAKAWLFGELQK